MSRPKCGFLLWLFLAVDGLASLCFFKRKTFDKKTADGFRIARHILIDDDDDDDNAGDQGKTAITKKRRPSWRGDRLRINDPAALSRYTNVSN